MVVYAVITEQSIGKLLIAGIVPGILTALIYCAGIYVIARVRPDIAPLADIAFTWKQRFSRSTACTASSSCSRSWWAASTAAISPPPTPARSAPSARS